MIALSRKKQSELVCAVLANHGITAALAEDIKEAIQRLEASTSAFLLLDLDLDGADLFLDAVVKNFYDPPPYVLVVSHYSSSAERTDILNRGADVCLEKPVDAEEVAAVINAAFRRALQMQRKGLKLTSCVTHKDMTIDPLRRIVIMEGGTDSKSDHQRIRYSLPSGQLSRPCIYQRSNL